MVKLRKMNNMKYNNNNILEKSFLIYTLFNKIFFINFSILKIYQKILKSVSVGQ